MVNDPVATTLATELPLIDPNRPLEMTATLAGPPLVCPAIALAMSIIASPMPVLTSRAPNSTKITT